VALSLRSLAASIVTRSWSLASEARIADREVALRISTMATASECAKRPRCVYAPWPVPRPVHNRPRELRTASSSLTAAPAPHRAPNEFRVGEMLHRLPRSRARVLASRVPESGRDRPDRVRGCSASLADACTHETSRPNAARPRGQVPPLPEYLRNRASPRR